MNSLRMVVPTPRLRVTLRNVVKRCMRYKGALTQATCKTAFLTLHSRPKSRSPQAFIDIWGHA